MSRGWTYSCGCVLALTTLVVPVAASGAGSGVDSSVRHQAARVEQVSLPRFRASYRGTNANGVASYDVASSYNGYGTHKLRVLAPAHPAPGVPHNVLYVLPVEAATATAYGDGLETLRHLDAQNQYNLTI